MCNRSARPLPVGRERVMNVGREMFGSFVGIDDWTVFIVRFVLQNGHIFHSTDEFRFCPEGITYWSIGEAEVRFLRIC